MKRSIIIIILLIMLGSVSFAEPKIAVVKSRDTALYNDAVKEIEIALNAEIKGIKFSVYSLEGEREKGKDILASIKKEKADLILTLGTLATQIARDGINDTPIVFTFVLNPISSGLISSFESSGNNLTGVALDIPPEEQFSNFRLVVPGLKTVGVLYNPKETGELVDRAIKSAKAMGITLKAIPVDSEEQVPEKLKSLEGVDGLWMVADSVVYTPGNTQYIILYTLKEGLPFMGISEQVLKAGALLAKTFDINAIPKQTVQQIKKVLEGRNPAEIKVMLPENIELVLNLKVAKEIGLSVPESTIKKAGVIYK